MAENNQDNTQKTEQPTLQQLENARKDGKIPTSREVVTFSIFVVLAVIIYCFFQPISQKFVMWTNQYISHPHTMTIDSVNIISIIKEVVKILLFITSIPLLMTIIAVLLSYFIQHQGFVISIKSLEFDLSKISILKGLERLFSLRSLVEFGKGILKICLVGIVSYFSIHQQIQNMILSFRMQFNDTTSLTIQLSIRMMITICFIMFIIAIVDFLYQRFEHIKGLRMSVQDIKDEHKNTEGNPEVKSKQRSKRKELLKQFNLNDVMKSDVVIMNPTHYAIALEYNPENMEAPRIAAKGSDLVALQIKKIAIKHLIPVFHNTVLARTLFNSVDVGEFIPIEHYKTVAEVISYVMNLDKKNRIISYMQNKKS